jgi:glutamine synthetase
VYLADLLAKPRGKRLRVDALPSVYSGGFRLPASMFALDVTGNTIEATGLGFDDGDADRSCLPVKGSLVPSPWMEGVGQVQVSMLDHDGEPFFADPRHVLAGIVERLRALKITPVTALELEFYVLRPDRLKGSGVRGEWQRGRRIHHRQINSLAQVEDFSVVLTDIVRACETQGVPATSMLAESGVGQFEVNLQHVSDACLACDHAVRLKRIVRGVCRKHGWHATFMAKPHAAQPGSGMHLHVSLLQEDGSRIFAESEERLRHAIGGLGATMSDSMLIFAPTANSYRRIRPEAYVPLAPTWGFNNRGVALRIPADTRDNRRIEHRVAGADVNPYLLTAVVLAGIHYGLSHKITPAEPTTGNAYRSAMTGLLPTSWREAAGAFERSAFIREYFGSAFQQLFATSRRTELQAFDAHVTPLEYEWYLDAG